MRKVTSRDGTEIAYDKAGDGPTLIYVSAAIQHRAIDPTIGEFTRQLADHFTVISYDRRGRGESGDTPPYAVEREIEDIAALIEESGTADAFLYGLSSGAVLALEAAAAGLPVKGIVVYEPPMGDFRPGYVDDLDRLSAEAKWDDVAETFFRDGVRLPTEHIAGMRQSPFWDGVRQIAGTLPYDARIVANGLVPGSAPQRWRDITAPVLLVNGDATMPLLKAAADEMARAFPHWQRRVLAGQDHGPKPEAIAPVIREFFAA